MPATGRRPSRSSRRPVPPGGSGPARRLGEGRRRHPAAARPDGYLTAKNRCGGSALGAARPIGGMIVTRSEVAAGTAIPNFADVPLAHGSDGTPPTPAAAADRIAAAASAHGYSPDQLDWVTPRGSSKPLYTGADRDAVVAAGYPLDSLPGNRRSSAGPIRRCTSTSRGPSASTRASRPRRTPTRSTDAIWRPARKDCRWPSTWPPTAATTPTTHGCRATSGWPGWPSTPFWTCANCSTGSTWAVYRCR